MLRAIFESTIGSKSKKDLKKYLPVLRNINKFESWALSLSDEDFAEETDKFRDALKEGKTLEDILERAFALSREAARRRLKERPYDVQLIAGLALHQGKIIEMKTGEGKTLSSVQAAYLNSLNGDGVIIVTVNDYLAERDSNWMKPVFDLLGVSVGVVLSNMDSSRRKAEYDKDITYVTNNELGFDYLRDNMCFDLSQKSLRNFNYCIIDEIDSILIDEARTPLIISGSTDGDTSAYLEVNSLVSLLKECSKDLKTGDYPLEIDELDGDYTIDEKGKRISFTVNGLNNLEKILVSKGIIKGSMYVDSNFNYVHYMTQALKAHLLFFKDREYIVGDSGVEIVDEFTGRILKGRRYSDGLHQAIEAKEGVKVASENKTMATITFQNLFRMFNKISGMTGTADTEAKEFHRIYNLDVIVVPTNRVVSRIDEDDIIYYTEEFKFKAITDEVYEAYKKGQPVLVGTVSIEKSEILSNLFKNKGIKHEVLNAKNHFREALIIAEAGSKHSVTIATNMAGRGTDIKLGGNLEHRVRKKIGTGASLEEFQRVMQIEREQYLKDYAEVKDLGGLYVIGSERHESRRIDNQLRGRGGRQGDPGRSRFYVSLEDDLMRLFAGDNLRALMGKLGMATGEPITHSLLTKSLVNAQKRVEDRNFEIRKHLLEYDDVITNHRQFIYSQRNSILIDNNIKERILLSSREYLDFLFDQIKGEVVTSSILNEINSIFAYMMESIGSVETMSILSLKDKLMEIARSNLEEKEELIGAELLNEFLKHEYLRNIDSKFQDHLANLDSLRESVYLRSYANKNPITEYKEESFTIFSELVKDIKVETLRRTLQMKVDLDSSGYKNKKLKNVSATHKKFSNIEFEKGDNTPGVQIVRNAPKIGRNQPCYCGAKKKYKNCHGKD
ncbi:preprotein translocase subunit SecA [Borrelia miyamotoi]|uniref:Protein translocase subunit SecA n=1 Tax=Borrelia miyamotoi TaxID=47466 RepID=A0AAX3JN62_9SPIR|nr:preprotein translocase subunit SecA [Borrelia miyamotoi]QFP42152.1 preprotein translocase subunit SecA [Borrelia miyamotoi]QFP48267.1 preprotein translocase subunit SecA [Borrelia miyamotoi]QGT56027.1 preprotein translocase subunit SecA [Borrelia miyamotoi]QGT56808.1 preprotein translocase subunit SecA [Borrelia miyamotoi]WAZ72070.1 preprotein translocase subunit SecA [Borrelia miyamotoi]